MELVTTKGTRDTFLKEELVITKSQHNIDILDSHFGFDVKYV